MTDRDERGRFTHGHVVLPGRDDRGRFCKKPERENSMVETDKLSVEEKIDRLFSKVGESDSE